MTRPDEPTAADVMCTICGKVGTAETDPAKRIPFVMSALWWAAHTASHPEADDGADASRYVVMMPREDAT